MGHVREKQTPLATSPVAAYLGLERKERSAVAKIRERSRSTINDHTDRNSIGDAVVIRVKRLGSSLQLCMTVSNEH